MNFALIICTYNREHAIEKLMHSVAKQTLYPDQVLIVDASENQLTEQLVNKANYLNTIYYKVDDDNKGLTKQRNFGIGHLTKDIDVVCFLDDDIILESDYFEQLIATYQNFPNALAVGGFITNEVHWEKCGHGQSTKVFYNDGFCREEPLRFRIRKWLGLQPDVSPCYLPTFGHGRSVSFLPPSGKTYEVELFMGGVSSYKYEVFNKISFSTFFEGYGLYEDADFCLRLSKLGKLYVNTSARLGHYHEVSGRPSTFKYGQMVVRNGWYVWRVKFEKISLKSNVKWFATEILLMLLTFVSALKSNNKRDGILEGMGRTIGLLKLLFKKPKLQK